MAVNSLKRSAFPHKTQGWSIVGRSVIHQRTFHVTSSRRILNESFEVTHSLLTGLHTATGLPWVVTLPLAGFIVRSILIGPLSIYSQIIGQRRKALLPLHHAWIHLFRRKIVGKHAILGPVECNRLSKKESAIKFAELNKRHGTQYWKILVPYLQLPVFLVIIETIRKMCGTHSGLLGLLTRSSTESTDHYSSAPVDQIEPIAILVEQSLAMEGALWFPNLLLPDPMLILPFVLSGSLFVNIFYHTSSSNHPWQRRINYTIKIMALAIGPLTLQVPSAMLVYWISSSMIGLGQSIIIQWYIPQVPTISPCKPREQREMLGVGGPEK